MTRRPAAVTQADPIRGNIPLAFICVLLLCVLAPLAAIAWLLARPAIPIVVLIALLGAMIGGNVGAIIFALALAIGVVEAFFPDPNE